MKWNHKLWKMIKMRLSMLNYLSIYYSIDFYWRKMGELGLLAPTVSEEYGGGGMDAVLLLLFILAQ